MRLFIFCLLFSLSAIGQNQDPKFDSHLGIELFRYNYHGLYPMEIHYQIDSLSADEIYNKVQYALVFGSDLIVDEKNKITKNVVNKSFVLKGRRNSVFCSEGLLGIVCLDAKYEIYFEFHDGGFLVRPIKFKRGANINNTVWTNIPLKGPAKFFKNDGTLKKHCLNCPEAIENILERVVTWTYRFVTRVEIPESN